MEWKKIITAIAALMLAYSLVGCANPGTDTSNAEVMQNYEKVECNYINEIDLYNTYGKTFIVTDKETGVEYLLVRIAGEGIAITPRLKGAE